MSGKRRGKSSRGQESKAGAPAATAAAPSFDFPAFLRGFVLWLLPAILVWMAITPLYNRFLTRATGNLVNIVERGHPTTITPADRHHFLIFRSDLQGRARGGAVGSVRVTDMHFPLIFLVALFMAVPGVPLGERLRALGWSALTLVIFHLVLLFFWVQFVLATQQGQWSARHYGTFAINFWGLGKHVLDLPIKLGLPLALWAVFYLPRLLPGAPRSDG